ncbi:hypothetical protein [Xanthomonas campestris]|uniref:hypothetical protein n=1 Tax=Xanthomonas campestris TaxID=339 RepID=UPI003890817C
MTALPLNAPERIDVIAQLREDTLMDAPQETPRTLAVSAAWVLARLSILHGRTQS